MSRLPGARRAAKIPNTGSASRTPTPLAANWLKQQGLESDITYPAPDDSRGAMVTFGNSHVNEKLRSRIGGAGKKKPRSGGALSFLLHRFERPGSSLSARAERAFRIQMNPRSAPARRVITSI
jgi:hypothetical protein